MVKHRRCSADGGRSARATHVAVAGRDRRGREGNHVHQARVPSRQLNQRRKLQRLVRDVVDPLQLELRLWWHNKARRHRQTLGGVSVLRNFMTADDDVNHLLAFRQ